MRLLTLQQKIVIKVPMASDKSRAKAMALVAAAGGVDSVAIAGAGKDQVVVVGEGVDSIKLTSALRKKVGHADLLHVGEVVKKDDKKPPPAAAPSNPQPQPVTMFYHHCCHPVGYRCYCYGC